jgi:hypothetical protein
LDDGRHVALLRGGVTNVGLVVTPVGVCEQSLLPLVAPS